MTLSTALLVAAAGAGGAVGRYLVDTVVARRARASGGLPWATFAVNVSGSAAAGVVAGLVTQALVGPTGSTVVASGFLGAYTTFSTFAVQTLDLARRGEAGAAAGYAAGSVVAATGAAALGLLAVSWVLG